MLSPKPPMSEGVEWCGCGLWLWLLRQLAVPGESAHLGTGQGRTTPGGSRAHYTGRAAHTTANYGRTTPGAQQSSQSKAKAKQQKQSQSIKASEACKAKAKPAKPANPAKPAKPRQGARSDGEGIWRGDLAISILHVLDPPKLGLAISGRPPPQKARTPNPKTPNA